MVTAPAHNLWVAYLTLLLAFMLSAFPLPAVMQWGWPEWVPLVCIYWVIALPHRFNLGLAFVVGLMLDLLQHNFLGMNALAMVVTIFFCLSVLSSHAHVSHLAASCSDWPVNVRQSVH